jgi:hypothetical protein
MDDDARRALRDSRPGYEADSVRSILRLAADREVAKVDLVQSIYLSRRVNPLDLNEVLVTANHLADTLGRDDDEREALAAAFREVDVKGDGAWLRLADVWLKVVGAET